jgi:opacity protein-like surface antigen
VSEKFMGVSVKFSKIKLVVLSSLAVLFPNPVFSGQPANAPVQTQGEGGPNAREMPRPNAPVVPLPSEPSSDPLKADAPSKPKSLQGLRVGSFMVSPEISLTELYDDNIYATRSKEIEDWITIISPTLSVKSDWEKHSLNIWAGADADIYRSNPSENVVDHWLEAEGRYDISGKTNVYAGAGISRNHEDRANMDDPARTTLAAEPTRYWETKGHLGAFHQFDAVSVRLGTTYEHLDFSNVPTLGAGVINMNDRDRKLYSAGGRVSYKISPKYEAFAQAATDNRRYDMSGVGRDSNGYRIAAGMGLDFGGNNKAEAYVGYLKQNYKTSGLADVSKPYFGAEAKFATGPSTYVSAFIDRELAETTVTGASSYLDTTVGARVDHDMNQDLSLNGRLSLSRSQFQGVNRDENYLDAGFGAKYYVSKDVYLAGDYRVLLRETNENTAVVNGTQNTFDYAKNQIYFSVGYTPGRVPRPVTVADISGIYLAATDMEGLEIPVDVMTDYSGFYVGAQTGYGALSTEVSSKRADGSTDEMDLGKTGDHTYGLFAGYGRMWNRWYYGVEAQAENGNQGWYHKKVKPDARTMSVDKNGTYGVGLRLGRALDGGLLYGSFGLVRTNFDTYDTENQFANGAYNKDKNVKGNRYGIGVDLPASNNLFVRMNYSYTHYDKYNATSFANATGTAVTVDRMANNESLFNVGLGWRFGGQDQPMPQVEATSARGFYAGAKMGYGAVNTKLEAIHNDGGGAGCTNCAFTGDFGKTGGTWGVFGGYGTTLSRVYLGLELEAEAGNNADWINNRESGGGGRDVSVSKKGTYGAGVKVGYVLNNGALLYARAGEVQTRFNTIYNKGSANNWVDRDDILRGNRFGVGAEVPAYNNVFVKMDYAVTNYGTYSFTTLHANADTESFDNKESLFSLGLGMRF